jgi:1-deoxy-D-xylulose-5-phosphate reductoisomerase
MNAADEVAVAAFLEGRISFTGIWKAVGTVMDRHDTKPCDSLGAVCEADGWARRTAAEVVAAIK